MDELAELAGKSEGHKPDLQIYSELRLACAMTVWAVVAPENGVEPT